MGKSKGAIRVGGVLILMGVVFSVVSGAWAVAGGGVADVGFGAVDEEAGPSEALFSMVSLENTCAKSVVLKIMLQKKSYL